MHTHKHTVPQMRTTRNKILIAHTRAPINPVSKQHLIGSLESQLPERPAASRLYHPLNTPSFARP